MLSALATSHKIGIAVVAAIFICFALASAFLVPRLSPDFPGRHLRLYVAVTVLITAGMLTAIIVLAREPKEPREAAAATTSTPATTAETTTAPASTTTAPAQGPSGNPAAGKALFAAQGCGACHTFKPAGSSGAVGPSLDGLAADAAQANRGSVQEYATESIKSPSVYVVPGYPQGVMPQFNLTDKQVADLVAFLTQPA